MSGVQDAGGGTVKEKGYSSRFGAELTGVWYLTPVKGLEVRL